MHKFSVVRILLLMLTFGTVGAVEHNSLLPRSLLFAAPQYSNVQISPDGKYLSYLSPSQGVLNVNVVMQGQMHNKQKNKKSVAKVITNNNKRSVMEHFWAYNNTHILYMDDVDGDENWRLYSVNVETGKKLDLVNLPGVLVRIIAGSRYHPDELLIGMNNRRKDFFDLYKINVVSGEKILVYSNDVFVDFICDDRLNVKLGIESLPDGRNVVSKVDPDFNKKQLFSIPYEDVNTTQLLKLNKTADVLYLLDSRSSNTNILKGMDLQTKKMTIIAQDLRADIDEVLFHPTEYKVQGFSATYEKTQWTVIDKLMKKDLDYLMTVCPGEISINARTLNDRQWIVKFIQDNKLPCYYHYDRDTHDAKFLFSVKPQLENASFSTMESIIINSRDNLPLVSYLSLPIEAKENHQAVPMVLYVHGGPHSRDGWGYNVMHQWLTNRGYAVLSVNYRGSQGFGKKFLNAGNGEWGAKMHDDLIDAVNWAIEKGIADKERICIMGGSYGGYAALSGVTFTPDVFACAVDIVGPSSLSTLMQSVPPYWKPAYGAIKKMIGADPETKSGMEFLRLRSPLYFVDNIKKPLLIAQGANDPRVKVSESEQIVQAMQAKNIPVNYILYPDEGHGFYRSENKLSFFAITETFLAKHLGGKLESIKNDFYNSSLEIKVGEKYISELMPAS